MCREARYLRSKTLACLFLLACVSTSASHEASRDVNTPDQSSKASDVTQVETQIPTIGVLTQVLRDYKRFVSTKHLHIAASYVKWIEGAGARVVPILLNQNESYYRAMFDKTNGLLFPGGDNLLDPHKNTPMMAAAKQMYELATSANDRGDYYPIWGTCLGFELLTVLSSGKNMLVECSSLDLALPIQFNNIRVHSKMFQQADYANLGETQPNYAQMIVDNLSSKNLTYHYHKKCLTDKSLDLAGLGDFYRPLAYARDANNKTFINIFEARKYPYFGVQFHPEKPPFEFVFNKHQKSIPHSREAIAASRFFADFFVQQARLNNHQQSQNMSELQNALIYAYHPMYTALKRDMYEQRYLFHYTSVQGIDDEEFLDFVPDDDYEPPE